jgi:hypothetical protein
MMIRVMYNSGRFDIVKPTMLDMLLANERVSSFKRTTGWAVVGRDPVRGLGGMSYRGPDRRT